jgi:hypothetical protein
MLGFNGVLNQVLLKWLKLVMLCMVMVLGIMEYEHIFSNVAFLAMILHHVNLKKNDYSSSIIRLIIGPPIVPKVPHALRCPTCV